MIAASESTQRPRGAKLLVVDERGSIRHEARPALAGLLRPGDLLIANDAATLPASLGGTHVPTGRSIEVRLAARGSLAMDDVREFSAIVFGEGDHRTRTEDRPAPPALTPGDRLSLGPLTATVTRLLGHARLVQVRFDGSPDFIWAGLAHHGRPIQYAHVPAPLVLWDVWTPIAGPPVAFEPPSAGFTIDWRLQSELRSRGIGFATLTHAAGISSTGDAELDGRLPFDEAYRIPASTAAAIGRAREAGGRIVAVGTTVVRAIEHADGRAGEGVATQRLGRGSGLRIADAIVSGTHEPGTSHYDLLGAFATEDVLQRMTDELEDHEYRTHEFGDSVLIENMRGGRLCRPTPGIRPSSRAGRDSWSSSDPGSVPRSSF